MFICGWFSDSFEGKAEQPRQPWGFIAAWANAKVILDNIGRFWNKGFGQEPQVWFLTLAQAVMDS